MGTSYTLILSNTTRTAVFVVEQEWQWALPELTFEQPYFWQDVGHINRAVHARWVMDVTTLRCRAIRDTAIDSQTQLVYELEYHDTTDRSSRAGRWIERNDADNLVFDHHALLMAWFDERTGPDAAIHRVPWYQPSWYETMLSWLTLILPDIEYTLVGPVKQVRSWERAAIWRVPTNKGDIFFKAVPPMFHHEPALTALLAEHFPLRIPTVLAFNVERGWLLMADAGSQRLFDVPELERWEEAIQEYATMQVALIGQLDALRPLGVPWRDIAWLRSGMERLFGDTPVLTHEPGGLSADEVVSLLALEPALLTACAMWERCGIPVTLEHGDFSMWQIQLDGASCRFLDWSDAALAPPFFSMLGVLGDALTSFHDVPDAASRLQDAYLKPWTEFAAPPQLRAAFDAAQRLAPLYHAVRYFLDILPAMEQRWEMEQMVPYYLRMLLVSQE